MKVINSHCLIKAMCQNGVSMDSRTQGFTAEQRTQSLNGVSYFTVLVHKVCGSNAQHEHASTALRILTASQIASTAAGIELLTTDDRQNPHKTFENVPILSTAHAEHSINRK